MTFNIEVEITNEQIENLIVNSIEGGSSWLDYDVNPLVKDFKWDNGNYAQQILNGEVKLNIYDAEYENELLGRLNVHTIKEGLKIMNKDYEKHFIDIINETDDADTADVFMQCCVMGKVIFG